MRDTVELNNYDQFYNLFTSETNKDFAHILLQLQHLLISFNNLSQNTLLNFGIDELRFENKNFYETKKKDFVIEISEKTEQSCLYLIDHLKKKNLREHVMLPSYKVQEMDSYCINWLSKQPGETMRKKMANSRSIMAVKRRSSFDTGENRLFLAFLFRLNQLLDLQQDCIPKEYLDDKNLKSLRRLVKSTLKDENLEEIRKWDNLPPNNTLLSDRHYRVIWSGWSDLKNLDDILKNHITNIDNYLTTMLFLTLIHKLQSLCIFPNIPIDINKDLYDFSFYENRHIFCMDSNNCIMTFNKNENYLNINFQENKYYIQFEKTYINILKNDEIIVNAEKFDESKLQYYIDFILKILNFSTVSKQLEPVIYKKKKDVVLDIFSIVPYFLNAENKIQHLDGRLMIQKFLKAEKKEQVLSCYNSSGIMFGETNITTYTILNALFDQSSDMLKNLVLLLKNKLKGDNLTFISPDYFNEFELAILKKNLKLAYKSVKSFPKSMALSFYHQQTNGFSINVANESEFLLVVDLIKNKLTLTLVKADKDDNLIDDIPYFNGLVWERHPCFEQKISFKNKFDLLYENSSIEKDDFKKLLKIFGIEGILSEKENLFFFKNDKEYFNIDTTISEFFNDTNNRINIDYFVEDFLTNRKELIGDAPITLIFASDFISYFGDLSYHYYKKEDALLGFLFYEKLQKNTSISLWRDKLPQLAIKNSKTSVDLVKDQKITPIYGVAREIEINQTIKLTKGKKKYRFQLVKNDSGSGIEYQAIVEHKSFPLDCEVECKLEMIYTYGDEEPYQLYFVPINSKNLLFNRLTVKWSLTQEYDWENLDYPDFPIQDSFELLQKFPSKRKDMPDSNLINNLCEILSIDPSSYINKNDLISNNYRLLRSYQANDVEVEFSEFNVINAIKYDTDLFTFNIEPLKTYSVDLFEGTPYTIWTKRSDTIYFFDKKIEIDGEELNINFSSKKFVYPEEFYNRCSKITFSRVHKEKNGNISALDIRPDTGKRYHSTNFKSEISQTNIQKFIMYRIFFNGRSLMDAEFPTELRNLFAAKIPSYIDEYTNASSKKMKQNIFLYMSLLHQVMGTEYYELCYKSIHTYIKNSNSNKFKLRDSMGLALGDYTTENQKKLFKYMLGLKPYKMVCLLSKAVWNNEKFIENCPTNTLLHCFDLSVHSLKKLFEQYLAKKQKISDIAMHLEFLLGIFRLRKFGDENTLKKLSLNDSNMKILSEIIEKMQQENIKIISRIKINLKTYDENYSNVDTFLYVFMLYVKGDTDGCDIIITSNDDDEQ